MGMDTRPLPLPSFDGLGESELRALLDHAVLRTVPKNTIVVSEGDETDAVFFILSGRAVAGIAQADGAYRSLSSMTAGDFFGEIAALTGAPRTANVVADQPLTLLQVPADVLRKLMARPALSQLFLAKMSERLGRTSINDLPRFAGPDQKDVRELRTAAE